MQIRFHRRFSVGIILLASTLLLPVNALAAAEVYQLSTHILDINRGLPVASVKVKLYRQDKRDQPWQLVAESQTDKAGRIGNFLPGKQSHAGMYKLQFATQAYFASQGLTSLYPYIEVIFMITGETHYHIPLTLTANGYSTYKGS